MAEVDQVQITNFGGLNTNSPADQLEDNEFQILHNFVNRKGTLQKRGGSLLRQNLSSESEVLTFVGCARDTFFGGDYIYLYDFDGHTLYGHNDYASTVAALDVFDTDVQDIVTNICSGKDANYVVINDGTDLQLVGLRPSFIGSPEAFEVISGPDFSGGAPSFLLEHQDRLWAIRPNTLNEFDSGSTLSFTEPGDYTTLSTNQSDPNTITIPNVFIVEMQSLDDKILLFGAEGGVYVLITQGSPRNWVLRSLDSSININGVTFGTSRYDEQPYGYYKSTIKYKNLVYVLAHTGLYVTDGTSFNKLSSAIDNYCKNISSVNNVGESVDIDIFNHYYNELIIKVLYDETLPPKFFIYSIDKNIWSEFSFSVPNPDPPSDGYPYAFSSIFYSMNGGLIEGVYFYSNHDLGDKNKLYNIRTTVRLEDRYAYEDGGDPFIDNSGTPYESTVKTKEFDFGNKGINKKCKKQFFTTRVINTNEDIAPLNPENDILITQYINGNSQSPVSDIVNRESNLHKIAGPGYFDTLSVEFTDVDAHDYWELTSIGFDLYRKPELQQTTGQTS